MRIKTLLFGLLAAPIGLLAQLQVNPQLGMNFANLTDDTPGVDAKASAGFQLGVDFARVGDRFYFQPGAYFGRNVTAIKYTGVDTAVVEDDLIRTTAKVKALVGFHLIDGGEFKLRVNAGPTYEALLSVDSKDDKIAFNKDDYNGGSFNMDGGVGIDLWILTAETGISYGLSKAFKEKDGFSSDAKYMTFYFTLGIVLGKSGGSN